MQHVPVSPKYSKPGVQSRMLSWLAGPGRVQRRLLGGALLLLALYGLLGWAHLSARHDYILVIDCGSTGTRIYAYKWQWRPGELPKLHPVPPTAARHKLPRKNTARRAYDRVETEPGLHTFHADAAGLGTTALGPLLEWAAAVVPPRARAATPVFLFGTAGLRRLTAGQQFDVMAAARTALEASPFRFEPEWARVVSGVDEGVFGWIALNYATGHLAVNPALKAAAAAATGPPADSKLPGQLADPAGAVPLNTVGSLDLGGSSLEVTFVPPPGATIANDADKVTVRVAGVEYPLYSHVHHGFGLNDAFDASVGLLSLQLSAAAAHGKRQPRLELDSAASVVPDVAQSPAANRKAAAAKSADKAASAGGGGKPKLHGGIHGRGRSSVRGAGSSGDAEAAANASSHAGSGSSASPGLGKRSGGGRGSSVSGGKNELRSFSERAAHDTSNTAPGRRLQAADDAAAAAAADGVAAAAVRQHSRRYSHRLQQLRQQAAHRQRSLQQAMVPLADSAQAAGSTRRLLAGNVSAAGAAKAADSERRGAKAGDTSPGESSGSRQAAPKAKIAVARERAGGAVLPPGGPPTLLHPCLHEGYNRTYRRLGGPGRKASPPMVVLVGRPDWEACAALAAAVVNASSARHCGTPPCALGAPQPATTGTTFYALTGFHVVYHFYHLQPSAPLPVMEAAARAWCAMPWATVDKERGRELHVDSYCFRAPYVAALLRHGLAVSDANVHIGSGNVAWTLGAALAEGSKVVFPRSLHASFAGSALNSPHLRAALWLIAIAATAAWLAAAAAAAGLAAGSSRQFAASAPAAGGGGGGFGSGGGFGAAAFAPGMARAPSLRNLGLQRFPSMPALGNMLGFWDGSVGSRASGGGFGSGGGPRSQPQGVNASDGSQPAALRQPYPYKAVKGNGARISTDGGAAELPTGGGGGSWAAPAAAGNGAQEPTGSQVHWGTRMSPPPTPQAGDGTDEAQLGSNAHRQQQPVMQANGSGWAGGRTGAKRRGLR